MFPCMLHTQLPMDRVFAKDLQVRKASLQFGHAACQNNGAVGANVLDVRTPLLGHGHQESGQDLMGDLILYTTTATLDFRACRRESPGRVPGPSNNTYEVQTTLMRSKQQHL